MSLSNSIKQRIFRAYIQVGSMLHIRHWRGRRIHSPFMYAIVRNVFMKRNIASTDTSLYLALRSQRISRRNAIQIQNLHTHCKYNSYRLICDASHIDCVGLNFCVMLPSSAPELLGQVAARLSQSGGCMVVLAPHRTMRLWRASQQIWADFDCVSVDRRVMTLCFFDTKLQPQHYRI